MELGKSGGRSVFFKSEDIYKETGLNIEDNKNGNSKLCAFFESIVRRTRESFNISF